MNGDHDREMLREAGIGAGRRIRRLKIRAQSEDALFQQADAGSGIFGRWQVDANGLPCYHYELDQYADERAYFPNTAQLDRRDHWHQIGNDRITALVSNDGTVQVYMGDRGGVFLNLFAARTEKIRQPSARPMDTASRLLWFLRRALKTLLRLYFRARQWLRRLRVGAPSKPPAVQTAESEAIRTRGVPAAEPTIQAQSLLREPLSQPFAFAGGFGYIELDGEVWSTAFRYRKDGSTIGRLFGIGYYETEMTYRDVRVKRRVYAPYGDDPCLLVDVEFENLGGSPVEFAYYEYWDVNVCQLKLQWLRGRAFGPAADEERLAINNQFHPSITWDGQALRFHQQFIDEAADENAVNEIDVRPSDVFLADMTGRTEAYYVDKVAFFGDGGAKAPDAARRRYPTLPDAPSTDSMPYCMALKRTMRLAAGGVERQRYAYGAVRPTGALQCLDAYRDRDAFAFTVDQWKREVVRFDTGQDAALRREMAWHSYYLLSSTVYNAYYRTHLTPQGSAYLYLHGADGVPRDQALFALPLVYLRPALARDTLRLIMALQHHKTGRIPYSFTGHGYQHGAFIHDAPSDLDFFFLLAMNEYLAATGDFAFLREEMPFYTDGERPALPPGARGTSVLDHIRAAVCHLINEVGRGDHGLVKIGDGDWSDGVVFDAALQLGGALAPLWFHNSMARGESVPNSQMALYVLPRTAALMDSFDADLSRDVRAFLTGLEEAVQRQWNGRWYTRAVLRDAGDKPVVLDYQRINLESQPWALISGVTARRGVEAELIKSVTMLLDDPSPTGAPLLENGMVWPAVSQLLTWGYCRSRPDLAWRSLLRHTFTVHSAVFPDNWINTWSGPDATFSKGANQGGGTWESPATPMTDFPIMNNNQHAMTLLGLLRVCGVEPLADGSGLMIAPCVPRDQFTLDTALLRLDVSPASIVGEYRPVAAGKRVLAVRVPPDAANLQARVDGAPVALAFREPSLVRLTLDLSDGRPVRFDVTWQ